MTLLWGIGTLTARRIIDQLEDEEQFFYLKEVDIHHLTGVRLPVIKNSRRIEALKKADKIIDQHSKFGVKSVYIKDDFYPQRLAQCIDAPIILYQKGNTDLNSGPTVAIVGTRNNTYYGERAVQSIIKDTLGYVKQTVSGLAEGIDTIVHAESIKNGIPTIAVLGHGLDRVYPRSNMKLAGDILENDGSLITEFPFGTNPDRENFPKRNRIVAGMANSTIVVESTNKGGSMITAQLAFDYNRDVFAVPGSIFNNTSEGCNKLIANDIATPLISGRQFITSMGWDNKTNAIIQKGLPVSLNGDQNRIFDLIRTHSPISIDLLSLKLKMPISKLNVELLQLELKGVINSLPGCEYTA